ncbi:LysR family transcriptional regulator [Donghicola sp. C2-DW-16]|uniref:LysR family transcriptional regulator n=1 Tax=Donghicola mangrovi TaxID=2729614 RepID=A0ABX2PE87_9RHOB|nr:LysR family transcriptional regulator [Donghicola mangrovi]NVO27806.1 LysR family transcriptional regulator [Donghicola mangrovi]
MPSFKNWDDLRYLIAFYRTGNMATAAQRLDSNPATVSRRMARLGEALGYPPFEKRPEGWVLNPRLESIVEQALKFDGALISAIRKENEETSGNLSGNITISVPMVVGTYILYPRLSEFMTAYPEINLSFILDSYQENLNDNDILMTPTRPEHGRLIASQTGVLRFGLYAHKDAGSKTDWAGLPIAVNKYAPTSVATEYFGCPPVVRLDSFQSLHRVASETGLSAPLPDFIGDNDPLFERIIDAPPLEEYPMYLCYHETRRSDPVLKAVREWIRDCMTDHQKTHYAS